MADAQQMSKVLLKIVQIARWRVRGVKDAVMCQHFGLTQSGLSRLVASEQYIAIENQILEGVLSQIDETIEEDIQFLRRKFATAVPAAMQGVLECAMQNKDLRTKLASCEFILDRDPNRTIPKDGLVGNGAGQTQGQLPQAVRNDMNAQNAQIMNETMPPLASQLKQ